MVLKMLRTSSSLLRSGLMPATVEWGNFSFKLATALSALALEDAAITTVAPSLKNASAVA